MPRTDPPKPAAAVEPLNAESLTWKYFGDIRTGVMGMWIGTIENMYPGLGAACGRALQPVA